MQPFLSSNNQIINKTFISNLKLANVALVIKKKDSIVAENYKPADVLPMIQRGLRVSCKNNLLITSTSSYNPFYVATNKGMVHELQ